MRTLLLYPLFAFVIYIVYRLATQLYYRVYLAKRLKNANLEMFKKILGSNYQYKLIHAEAIKYKWTKGWFIARAVFDSKGNLIEHDKPTHDYSRLIAAFYFTKDGTRMETKAYSMPAELSATEI